jgi:hypothetical protein
MKLSHVRSKNQRGRHPKKEGIRHFGSRPHQRLGIVGGHRSPDSARVLRTPVHHRNAANDG